MTLNKTNLNIRMAVDNLSHHKLRSSLAILGIWIGSAAIVALLASSTLATHTALQQFQNLGTDFLAIEVNEKNPFNTTTSSSSNNLDLTEIQDLSKNANIETIAPYFFIAATTTYYSKPIESYVLASTQQLQNLLNIKLASGRFITELDQYNSFCVIGADVNNELRKLGNFSAIGSQIKIGSFLFTIVGILKQSPNNLFFIADLNKAIVIPIARSYLFNGSSNIDHLLVQFKSNHNYKISTENLVASLAIAHPDKQFITKDSQQLLNVMHEQRRTFNGLLIAIASISLLSGGIGVMNMMLVAVTERRKEIGLRMAIGANSHDILWLFLNEALILSLAGGLIGVLSGQFAAYILAHLMKWQFHFDLVACLTGFGVASLIGMVAGIYPAYHATKLEPLEILLNSN